MWIGCGTFGEPLTFKVDISPDPHPLSTIIFNGHQLTFLQFRNVSLRIIVQ